jgi:hypothetical protein
MFILKNLFPQKESEESFIDPASTVGLQLLILLLLKNFKGDKDGVVIIKPGL